MLPGSHPLEPLFWMGSIYFLLLAANRQQPQILLWCGVLLGVGLENKHSTVFFLGGVVAGSWAGWSPAWWRLPNAGC
jgi:4-amino-4-deoxy-L-arabinose transferase-like glycosyltransferase